MNLYGTSKYKAIHVSDSSKKDIQLIKKNQGHKKIEKPDLIQKFEKWIKQFEKNKVYADPQMRWLFDRELSDEEVTACSKEKLENDEDENEETVC